MVEFLARRYSPAVWDGDPTSCSDITRQLGKWHLSDKKFDPRIIAFNKALGYAYSDYSTPVIRDIVHAILVNARNSGYNQRVEDLQGFWTRQELNLDMNVHDQYPNACHVYATEQANQLGNLDELQAWCTELVTDGDHFLDWLNRAPLLGVNRPALSVPGDLDGGNAPVEVLQESDTGGMQPGLDLLPPGETSDFSDDAKAGQKQEPQKNRSKQGKSKHRPRGKKKTKSANDPPPSSNGRKRKTLPARTGQPVGGKRRQVARSKSGLLGASSSLNSN
jgi:hypothetical protein